MKTIPSSLLPTTSCSRKVRFVVDDGGRSVAGYRGQVRDCVSRSVSIATGAAYASVYRRLEVLSKGDPLLNGLYLPGPNTGVQFSTVDRLMGEMGFTFTPHATCLWRWGKGNWDLPSGRLVLFCGNHCTAMVDGVLHDTYDPVGKGWRLVGGYWSK